jgi:hypothetical protein
MMRLNKNMRRYNNNKRRYNKNNRRKIKRCFIQLGTRKKKSTRKIKK